MRTSSGRSTARKGVPLRKRTRSGCLPCRSRRRKCDGARPRCRNCESRGCTCQWGLKASFHPSRNFSLSHRKTAALTAIEDRRDLLPAQLQSFSIIDETEEIVRSYHVDSDLPGPSLDPDQLDDRQRTEDPGEALANSEAGSTSSGDPGDSGTESDLGVSDVTCLHAYDFSQLSALDSSRRLAGGGLSIGDLLSQPDPQSTEQTLKRTSLGFLFSPLSESTCPPSFGVATAAAPSTYAPPFSIGQAISKDIPPPPEPSLPVSTAEKARLICSYMQETGTWCETTDSEMHFTLRSIHDMMKSAAFAAAAMSLASRQLDYVERRQRSVTLELYQYTIQLLLQQDPGKADASVLATCTLLSVYEMMASGVHEWRRHLKGCAGLLQVQKWNGSSQGIVKSCFWAFARIDVWAAFISGKSTLIPTDFWLDDMSIESVAARGNVDDYRNLAILIFAKIVNLLSGSGYSENRLRSKFATSVSSLWNELQEWHRLRPQEVCPLLTDASPSKVFPTVLYTRSSSICGNTFYHAGSILLLQTGLLPVISESTPSPVENADSAVWHARQLAGLSMSNPSHANWVNHLQPLYIAGTVFAGSSTASRTRRAHPDESPDFQSLFVSSLTRGNPGTTSSTAQLASWSTEEEYPTEKILLLKHLARIERETGWKTSDRAASLRMLWGLG